MTKTVFAWKITQLERETADGYVFRAYYTVDANDDVYSATTHGSISLKRPDSLIPYNELQEEIVIDWVREALGGDEKVAEIEAALQLQLDEQHAPSKQAGLPWAA